MFKKAHTNCFKTTIHNNTSNGGIENDKHANAPFLSYYNHFLLPHVGLMKGSDNTYVPLEIVFNYASPTANNDKSIYHRPFIRIYVISKNRLKSIKIHGIILKNSQIHMNIYTRIFLEIKQI